MLKTPSLRSFASFDFRGIPRVVALLAIGGKPFFKGTPYRPELISYRFAPLLYRFLPRLYRYLSEPYRNVLEPYRFGQGCSVACCFQNILRVIGRHDGVLGKGKERRRGCAVFLHAGMTGIVGRATS